MGLQVTQNKATPQEALSTDLQTGMTSNSNITNNTKQKKNQSVSIKDSNANVRSSVHTNTNDQYSEDGDGECEDSQCSEHHQSEYSESYYINFIRDHKIFCSSGTCIIYQSFLCIFVLLF